ncbi:MAG: type II secretion system F family protein, partial [Desulfotomaculales bacterium]
TKTLRRTVTMISERLQGGATLTEATKIFPRVFPPVFVSMVEAGEVGGALEQVLENLATHFEKEHELKEKIKTAMIYPVTLLCFAILAVAVLTTFVLPKFTGLFSNLGIPLPLPTRMLIAMSDFARKYLLWGVLGAAATAAVTLRLLRSGERRAWLDKMFLKLPVFGQLVQKVIVARFTRTLGILLKSGIPVVRALEVVKNTSGNILVTRTVERVVEDVRQGQAIARSMGESGVFTPMVVQMVSVGEETGSLDKMLEKVALFYEREADAGIARLAAMVEPVIIIGMGVVIGFIVVAILLPYFQMLGSVV